MNKFSKRQFKEWLVAIVVALAAYLVITNFVFKVANISGISMEPTLKHAETVYINRLVYVFSKPKKGDIIAFPYKGGNAPSDYVKRIIGLPGDEIDLRDYKFYVNGEPLDDAYSTEYVTAMGDVRFPVTVPEGSYFVLGDNRNLSNDSRYLSVGCVNKSDIYGKVSLRILPISVFGVIK